MPREPILPESCAVFVSGLTGVSVYRTEPGTAASVRGFTRGPPRGLMHVREPPPSATRLPDLCHRLLNRRRGRGGRVIAMWLRLVKLGLTLPSQRDMHHPPVNGGR